MGIETNYAEHCLSNFNTIGIGYNWTLLWHCWVHLGSKILDRQLGPALGSPLNLVIEPTVAWKLYIWSRWEVLLKEAMRNWPTQGGASRRYNWYPNCKPTQLTAGGPQCTCFVKLQMYILFGGCFRALLLFCPTWNDEWLTHWTQRERAWVGEVS